MTILEFCQTIIALALKFRISVTSWGRTVKHNKDVGGSDESRHVHWLAVDVVFDDPKEKAPFMKECRRQGLIAVDEGDHVHVQTR